MTAKLQDEVPTSPISGDEMAELLGERLGIAETSRSLARKAASGALAGCCFAWQARWWYWPRKMLALIEAGGIPRGPRQAAAAGDER